MGCFGVVISPSRSVNRCASDRPIVPTGSVYFSFGESRFLRSPIGRLRRPFLLLSEVIAGNTLSLDLDNPIGATVPLAHCPRFLRSAFAVASRAVVFLCLSVIRP